MSVPIENLGLNITGTETARTVGYRFHIHTRFRRSSIRSPYRKLGRLGYTWGVLRGQAVQYLRFNTDGGKRQEWDQRHYLKISREIRPKDCLRT